VPCLTRDRVEAPMHAVDEIDISMTGGTVEDSRPLSQASGRVTRGIIRPEVRLGLDDPPANRALPGSVLKHGAQQLSRDYFRRAVVKPGRKRTTGFHLDRRYGRRAHTVLSAASAPFLAREALAFFFGAAFGSTAAFVLATLARVPRAFAGAAAGVSASTGAAAGAACAA